MTPQEIEEVWHKYSIRIGSYHAKFIRKIDFTKAANELIPSEMDRLKIELANLQIEFEDNGCSYQYYTSYKKDKINRIKELGAKNES